MIWLLKLLKERLGLEKVRDKVVESRYNFIDLFLPAGVSVFACSDRLVKLPVGLEHDPLEASRNLSFSVKGSKEKKKKKKYAHLNFKMRFYKVSPLKWKKYGAISFFKCI